MSEDKNVVGTASEKTNSGFDIYKDFIPSVHRLGRSTMIVGLVLTFLPVLYFVFVKGYRAPLTAYASVAIAIASACFGMWISEPLGYWPVLGSAGTYMGYLSGNVSGMRFPVALNLQSTLDADINTLKGQVATIIGVAASIFANLIILLVFVLAGQVIVTVLPQVVIDSFSFVSVGVFACLLITRLNGKGGLAKGLVSNAPYLLLAIVARLVLDHIPSLEYWKLLICVLLAIALSYVMYKRDCKKDEEAAKAGR